MLIDFAAADIDPDLHAGICIVGAGAAGVTLARGLAAQGLDICLLESGGFDHDPVTQSLGVGENVGMPYYDLDDSRLRFFGGTTSIWGGRCAPLDNIDFEAREWIPHSGWPIAREDLADGYRAAHRDLEIGQYEYGDLLWQTLAADPPPFDRERFVTPFWRFDGLRERFSARRAQDLLEHPNVRILIHANAVHLQAATNAGHLDHVKIASLGGPAGQGERRHLHTRVRRHRERAAFARIDGCGTAGHRQPARPGGPLFHGTRPRPPGPAAFGQCIRSVGAGSASAFRTPGQAESKSHRTTCPSPRCSRPHRHCSATWAS